MPFQKGKSGNPGGKPKHGFNLATTLERYGHRKNKETGNRYYDDMVVGVWKRAAKGDMEATKYIMDRVLGRPAQEIKLEGQPPALVFQIIDPRLPLPEPTPDPRLPMPRLEPTPENRLWLAQVDAHSGTLPLVHPECGHAHWPTVPCPESKQDAADVDWKPISGPATGAATPLGIVSADEMEKQVVEGEPFVESDFGAGPTTVPDGDGDHDDPDSGE